MLNKHKQGKDIILLNPSFKIRLTTEHNKYTPQPPDIRIASSQKKQALSLKMYPSKNISLQIILYKSRIYL